jgi:cobalamin transport system substrate-binding protein
MAAHKKSLVAVALVLALCGVAARTSSGQNTTSPKRIISVIPAATEILFAIGAGPQVVAVGSFDTFPPEVNRLPKVGALIDPDIERILSLKPDLVVVYASQTDLKGQLQRAGIRIYEYKHAGLADVTTTIRALGDVTGHAAGAMEIAGSVERTLGEIRARVKDRPKPRTLLIFGHERGALRGIYASGGVGFLDDMLAIAGGVNVFSDVKQQAVQASTEQIIARRPEAVLEIRASNSALPPADQTAEAHVWDALGSLPAVRTHRVIFLLDDRLVIPGPRVAEGTRLMAQALHPEAFR